MDKFYMVNYNRIFFETTDNLINIYLHSFGLLKKIAHDILINDNRLLDNNIDLSLIVLLLNQIDVEDLWYLASLPKSYSISVLAYGRLMEVLDDYDVSNRISFIKIIKKS